jgi:DTW domain-containing protein
MIPDAMVQRDAFEPRAVCPRCRRAQSVCYCRHLTSFPTRTRIVILQHPRERDVAIGTARMASLCLPSSELHVGFDWNGSPTLARLLGDPSHPPALLYPGEGAIDVVASPPTGPITLVVVDGTWAHAKKLVRANPPLAALPRYAFVPPVPSEYRIRREPRPTYVSTIEALVHVLGALEGDPERFTGLLAPFRAMIDAQLEHVARAHAVRHRPGYFRSRSVG